MTDNSLPNLNNITFSKNQNNNNNSKDKIKIPLLKLLNNNSQFKTNLNLFKALAPKTNEPHTSRNDQKTFPNISKDSTNNVKSNHPTVILNKENDIPKPKSKPKLSKKKKSIYRRRSVDCIFNSSNPGIHNDITNSFQPPQAQLSTNIFRNFLRIKKRKSVEIHINTSINFNYLSDKSAASLFTDRLNTERNTFLTNTLLTNSILPSGILTDRSGSKNPLFTDRSNKNNTIDSDVIFNKSVIRLRPHNNSRKVTKISKVSKKSSSKLINVTISSNSKFKREMSSPLLKVKKKVMKKKFQPVSLSDLINCKISKHPSMPDLTHNLKVYKKKIRKKKQPIKRPSILSILEPNKKINQDFETEEENDGTLNTYGNAKVQSYKQNVRIYNKEFILSLEDKHQPCFKTLEMIEMKRNQRMKDFSYVLEQQFESILSQKIKPTGKPVNTHTPQTLKIVKDKIFKEQNVSRIFFMKKLAFPHTSITVNLNFVHTYFLPLAFEVDVFSLVYVHKYCLPETEPKPKKNLRASIKSLKPLHSYGSIKLNFRLLKTYNIFENKKNFVFICYLCIKDKGMDDKKKSLQRAQMIDSDSILVIKDNKNKGQKQSKPKSKYELFFKLVKNDKKIKQQLKELANLKTVNGVKFIKKKSINRTHFAINNLLMDKDKIKKVEHSIKENIKSEKIVLEKYLTKEKAVYISQKIQNTLLNKLENIKQKLFLFIDFNDQDEFKCEFERYKQDVDVMDIKGNTYLNYAVQRERYDIVNFLLLKGANPNIPNNDKNTPLHFAMFWQNFELIDLLIKYGAKENVMNKYYKMPWQYLSNEIQNNKNLP